MSSHISEITLPPTRWASSARTSHPLTAPTRTHKDIKSVQLLLWQQVKAYHLHRLAFREHGLWYLACVAYTSDPVGLPYDVQADPTLEARIPQCIQEEITRPVLLKVLEVEKREQRPIRKFSR